MDKLMTYSNPRMEAVIKDWPSGAQRTTATFRIETHPTRGQRGTRFTLRRDGTFSATKVLTYAKRARIVTGSDARTYIAEDHHSHITIKRGDMRFDHETIWPEDDRRNAVVALFAEGVV